MSNKSYSVQQVPSPNHYAQSALAERWSKIHPVVEEFAYLIRKNVRVSSSMTYGSVPGTSAKPVEECPSNFFVNFGSYPNTVKKMPARWSPSKLFGIEVEYGDKVYRSPRAKVGVSVKDSRNVVSGIIAKDTLFILPEVVAWSTDSMNFELFLRRFFEAAINLLLNEKEIATRRKEYLQCKTEESREAYSKLCIANRQQEMATLENGIRSQNRAKENARKALVASLREIDSLQERVRLLKSMSIEQKSEKLTKEFDKIAKFPGVDGIWIDEDTIFVQTDTIITQPLQDKSRREIGKIRLEIPTDGEGVRVINLTRLVDGHPHPHVDTDGNVCLGNIEEGLYEFIGAYEFAPAVNVLMNYLKTINEGDTHGVSVYQWPKAKVAVK